MFFHEQQLNVDQARYYAKLCSNLDKQSGLDLLMIGIILMLFGTQSANGGFGPFKAGESSSRYAWRIEETC